MPRLLSDSAYHDPLLPKRCHRRWRAPGCVHGAFRLAARTSSANVRAQAGDGCSADRARDATSVCSSRAQQTRSSIPRSRSVVSDKSCRSISDTGDRAQASDSYAGYRGHRRGGPEPPPDGLPKSLKDDPSSLCYSRALIDDIAVHPDSTPHFAASGSRTRPSLSQSRCLIPEPRDIFWLAFRQVSCTGHKVDQTVMERRVLCSRRCCEESCGLDADDWHGGASAEQFRKDSTLSRWTGLHLEEKCPRCKGDLGVAAC